MMGKTVLPRVFRGKGAFAVLIFARAFFAAPLTAADGPSDSIVVVGAGASGSWVTELTLANSRVSETKWQLFLRPQYETGGCPALCPYTGGTLPPSGTFLVPTSIPTSITRTQVTSLYLTPEAGSAEVFIVRARVVNLNRPTQAIEVPAFRVSTLAALNTRVLAFPGARRDSSSRTNLVLANIIPRPNQEQGSDVTAVLEAYSSDGLLLGSKTVMLPFGETRFFVDILADLGVLSLDLGQLRVTKVSDEGLFWGTMFTTATDGGVTVSIGAHP